MKRPSIQMWRDDKGQHRNGDGHGEKEEEEKSFHGGSLSKKKPGPIARAG